MVKSKSSCLFKLLLVAALTISGLQLNAQAQIRLINGINTSFLNTNIMSTAFLRGHQTGILFTPPAGKSLKFSVGLNFISKGYKEVNNNTSKLSYFVETNYWVETRTKTALDFLVGLGASFKIGQTTQGFGTITFDADLLRLEAHADVGLVLHLSKVTDFYLVYAINFLQSDLQSFQFTFSNRIR